MKILVDKMPVSPNDDCWFSDQAWNSEEHIWKNYCTLGPDGCTDCDLKDGECSKLRALSGVSLNGKEVPNETECSAEIRQGDA